MTELMLNPAWKVLSQDFFLLPATRVAPALLGKLLLRRSDEGWSGGLITEAEAYLGEDDLGCHARAGLTPRTRVMYGPPGRAYVYFNYGMHWMLNAVTGEMGYPAAVLIRAIYPLVGQPILAARRPTGYRPSAANLQKGWTDGPAKLCQALGVDGSLNDTNLCDPAGSLLLADCGIALSPDQNETSARIGLFTAPEPWKSIPWRFRVREEYLGKLS